MSAPDLEMGEKLLAAYGAADEAVAHAPDASAMLIAEVMDAKDEFIDWATEHLPALLATARRVAEMEGVLKEIDGEAPANEPRDGWTSTDPNDAYQEGWVRGMWTAAVIARKAITP